MQIKYVISVLLLFLVYKLYNTLHTENNSCTTYYDYFFIDSSPNCYHNPDIGKETTFILNRLIGTYENHTVETEDGFLIHIFRLPRKNAKGVVVLQHAVTVDATIWVGQNDTSLAYLLWQKGYDVWMPNHRGTFYSNKHVNLDVSDMEFWNYTFEEIGLIDYSATFKFISHATDRKDLIFIGYSMASTASLVYASLKPDEASEHVKIFIHLAPASSLGYMTSGFRYLLGMVPTLRMILEKFGIYHVFQQESAWGSLFYLISFIPFKKIVADCINSLLGSSVDQFDQKWYYAALHHWPRGFSLKLLEHHQQLLGGRFCRFDYGREANLNLYNSTVPPDYPVWNIKTPVYSISSLDDSIATVEDNDVLYAKLSKTAKSNGRKVTAGLNHMDFNYGRNKITLVYDPIFKILDKLF